MKITLLSVVALMVSAVCTAQPKAVGLRANGFDNSLSYLHYSGHNADFVEIDASYLPFDGKAGVLSAVYDFSIKEWDFGEKGTLGIYAGAGFGTGYSDSFVRYRTVIEGHSTVVMGDRKGFDLYVPVQFGIEYKFRRSPFQVSLDHRPCPGVHIYEADGKTESNFTYYQTMFGLLPALGVRFLF